MRNSAMQIVTRLLGRLSEEIHRDPFAGCHLGAARRRGTTADNQRRRRSTPSLADATTSSCLDVEPRLRGERSALCV